MSNSPDDPRLIPGHPEFVHRPATWEKTVAKQIIKIAKAEERINVLKIALLRARFELSKMRGDGPSHAVMNIDIALADSPQAAIAARKQMEALESAEEPPAVY